VTPKWIVQPKDIRINSGQNIEIECKADGQPKPIIKWIDSKGFNLENSLEAHNSLELFKYLGKVFEGEVLRLKNVQNISVLKYECIADNGVDAVLRKSVKITVYSKKYFLQTLQKFTN